MKQFHLLVAIICVMLLGQVTGSTTPINNHESGIVPSQNYLENIDHYVYSNFTGRNYSLKVTLPSDYNPVNNYSVLFLFDYLTFNRYGNVFDLHTNINATFEWLIEMEYLPPMILVDILDSNFDTELFITHMVKESENTYSFLEEELVPFIASTYSINENDLYLSSSEYGGYFVLWSYFNNPLSVFTHFISAEGNYNYNQEKLIESEVAFNTWSNGHTLQTRSLYLSVNYSSRSMFEVATRVMRNMFSRGYQGQNNVFDVSYQEEWGPFLMVNGWFRTVYVNPTAEFTTNINLDYSLGDIDTSGYFVNETIEFLFMGTTGFKTVQFEWIINNTIVGNNNFLHFNFTTVGLKNVILNLRDTSDNDFNSTQQFYLQTRPDPPFDFHTIQSTSLNTETYKTKSTTNDDLSYAEFFIAPIILIPTIRRITTKKKGQ